MPENNQQDIETSIDNLNNQIATNAQDLKTARASRDQILSDIGIDKTWFETGKCKWKPGRKEGMPPSPSHTPTSGSSKDCGWGKNRYFKNLNLKSTSINRISSLESEKDDLELALGLILESSEAQANLDPDIILGQQELASERAILESEERKQAAELEAGITEQKEKSKRQTRLALYIIGGTLIIVVIYFVGKKQGWF